MFSILTKVWGSVYMDNFNGIKPKSIEVNPQDIIMASQTSLVNSYIDSNLALKPKLILNNYTPI